MELSVRLVMKWILVLLFIALTLMGCYRMRGSQGGGQIKSLAQRKITTSDILLAPGFKIESIHENLTFPSALTFDDNGNLYAIETGYSYGEVWGEPKLLRLDTDGKQAVIATGSKNGPWTGVTFHNGNFYVSEGGADAGGKILKISPQGQITILID